MDEGNPIDWLGLLFGIYLLLIFFIPALAAPFYWLGLEGSALSAFAVAAIAFPALIFLSFAYVLTRSSSARKWGIIARNIVLDTIAAAMAGMLYIMVGILVAANLNIWQAGTSLDLSAMLTAVFLGFLQVFASLRHMGYWKL